MATRGFAMVPGWLLDLKPSSGAIHAYVIMATYGTWIPEAGEYHECRPSRSTLAKRMGVSDATAKRALAELVQLGAAVRTIRHAEDGGQLPSVYRLIFGTLIQHQPNGGGSPVTRGGVTGDPGGRVTGDPGGGSQVTHNLEVIHPEPEHLKTTSTMASPCDDGRDDVTEIVTRLADAVEANGSLRPDTGKTARTAARLLIDKDGRKVPEILSIIDWCQQDEFWRGNILSMPKLRKQYDTLRLHSERSASHRPYTDPDLSAYEEQL